MKESAAAQLFVGGLRGYIRARDLSEYAFEIAFDIPRQTIRGWLSGRTTPQHRLVEKIARQLYVPAERLRTAEPWPLPDDCKAIEAQTVTLARAIHADAARTSSQREQALKWQEAGRILLERARTASWRGDDSERTVSTLGIDSGLWYFLERTRLSGHRTRVLDDGTLDGEREPFDLEPR